MSHYPRISVRIDWETDQILKRLADNRGMPRSTVVQRALERYLKALVDEGLLD
jgi:predicted DNA-binding protein